MSWVIEGEREKIHVDVASRGSVWGAKLDDIGGKWHSEKIVWSLGQGEEEGPCMDKNRAEIDS